MREKIYVMSDGLVLKTEPTDKNIQYTTIEVNKVPPIETKELYLGTLYYIDGEFITKFKINRNEVISKINTIISRNPIKSEDYKSRKIMESVFLIVMDMCDKQNIDVTHLLPYPRKDIEKWIIKSQKVREEIKQLEGLL